jgi:spermidine synthase
VCGTTLFHTAGTCADPVAGHLSRRRRGIVILGSPGATPLPIRATLARWVVLVAVLVCSACGLVYELALVAVAGQLGSDPVTETSVVLSAMVFAMGVGALAAKPFADRAAAAFAVVEGALAAVGGSSVTAVWVAAQWCGLYRAGMLAVCVATGALVGAEIPLLMTLVQRIRRQEAGHAIADLFAADYVGALAGGLLFPFLLLPALGQVGTVAAVGAVNAFVGACVVLWLFRADLDRRARVRVCALVGVVSLVLACVAAFGPTPPRSTTRSTPRSTTGATPAATRQGEAAKYSYTCSTGA